MFSWHFILREEKSQAVSAFRREFLTIHDFFTKQLSVLVEFYEGAVYRVMSTIKFFLEEPLALGALW